MKQLFRWYVGDPLSPCWVYPQGWSWLRPKRWWLAKCMTRLSTFVWNRKGGREEFEKMVRDQLLYGIPRREVEWLKR